MAKYCFLCRQISGSLKVSTSDPVLCSLPDANEAVNMPLTAASLFSGCLLEENERVKLHHNGITVTF